MNYPPNALTIEAYSSGTTQIHDLPGGLAQPNGLAFQTIYPGGIYATASFYVARNVFNHWLVKGARRVVIRNGRAIVYEGYIANLQRSLEETAQGIMIRCIGAWGKIMMGWRWRKRWADQRVSDDIWQWDTTATAAEKADIDRSNRLRITPKNVLWTSGQIALVTYAMPTGELVQKIAYDYNQAGANMKISFYDATNGEQIIVSGGGSGTAQTYSPATAVNSIQFRLTATGTHTPASDGTVYGQISNIMIYSRDATPITVEKVAADIVTEVTDMNSDTSFIDTPASALTIEPFMADDYETVAEILDAAVASGDGANNRWACGLHHSERATTPDGKPVLLLEQYPDTDDYDYVVSVDEPNVVGGINISQDVDAIANWVVVSYVDENGWLLFRSPDDNASLKDQTSIDEYGIRAVTLHIGDGTGDLADSTGIRYLATYKDPQWRLIGSLTLQSYIRKKSGDIEPASQVHAGKRIKVENFKEDLSGSGLTFVITQTDYRDDDQSVSIGTGVPTGIIMPRFAHPLRLPVDPVPTPRGGGGRGGGGGGGGGGGSRRRRQPTPAPAPQRTPSPRPGVPRRTPAPIPL